MQAKNSNTTGLVVPAAVVGAAIVLASLVLRAPLQRTAEELTGIRTALADTKQALQSVAQGRPAAPQPARGPDPNRRYTVSTAGAPARGPATAKVKIIEFSDFQ